MPHPSSRDNRNTSLYWYLPLILGIIFIALGVWVFNTPVQFFITLSLLFAFAFIMTGILALIHAITNRSYLANWGWLVAGGVIDLLIGILLVSRPQISMIILPLFVGFAILFRAIMTIAWSVDLKKQGVRDWGVMLVIGIIGAVFAFIMLWNPVFGGMTIAFYAAFSLILIGIAQVFLALRLRKANKDV